ncbi:MAG: ISNCY family transposase [Candidatus Acidiferrales bacterium]
MADIGLAAFSVFFMQSPSFLAHQRALAAGHGRSNCQTLLGMSAIPSDNHIRQMLDGNAPAAFDGLFMTVVDAVAAAGGLAAFQRLDGRVLVALDGTEHFCSRKIGCPHCSRRRRADGGVEYFHAFLAASLVAPGTAQVLPLPPEFITPQDGAEKQDCERTAAKRWLAKHGPTFARFRPVFLGDDLYACQPIATAIRNCGANFILTCKPTSHQTIAEYLAGVELEAHRQIVQRPGKRSTHIYRWLSQVPLRAGEDALLVNWFSIEILNAKGQRTYYNSFVTDLPITPDTVAELAACGRARWKIENETFNVLKTNGYNLEHNFGHGKLTLASLLVSLNLLAFALHTLAILALLAWRNAVAARGARYAFFEHLRTITAYLVFPNWGCLLNAIADPKVRPP